MSSQYQERSTPWRSLLLAGAGVRVLGALVLVLVLWLAAFWAMQG